MSSQNILQQIKNSQSLLPASRDPPLHPTRSRFSKNTRSPLRISALFSLSFNSLKE